MLELWNGELFGRIERYLTIRRADRDTNQFMATVRSYIHSGNLEQAKQYCIQENSPFARMILKGLNRLGSPLRDIASAIEAGCSLLVRLCNAPKSGRAICMPPARGILGAPMSGTAYIWPSVYSFAFRYVCAYYHQHRSRTAMRTQQA